MPINELLAAYESERKHSPETINNLLDFYQKKYIIGEIDIQHYRDIYFYLHKEGATSAHDYV
ncbi:YppF family protein [Virgibacillus ainsalahensis]